LIKKKVNKGRIELLQEGKESKDPVVFWMSRDQRVRYN